MLGIGPTELIVVAVLFLVIFGPSKMPQMARDIGKFVSQARSAVDEFKEELTAEELTDASQPTRKQEEGSRRRKDGQSQSDGHSHRDRQDTEDESEEGSSESKEREQAEYDL